jgi:hypothetical protein
MLRVSIRKRSKSLDYGGPASRVEAHRMVMEKGFAFAEAAASLAVGVSPAKVVRRYCSHVRSNKRRLSRR